ncbi:methyltransferase RsmF C-terminal domain-like protein [Alistipes sp.]|uniref:methyltransferase RsmF C-terminal domain-like protein n=1 Tax=Alistipes sp. TaxID=1872444 RepID=UPI003A848A63
MSLPERFVERLLRDLGPEEGRALCEALEREAPTSVRFHPAKGGAEPISGPQGAAGTADPAGTVVVGTAEVADPAGTAGLSVGCPHLPLSERVPWCDAGWYLRERPSFTFDPDFHAGAYYVQEASSQFVGYLLRGMLPAGARLLDLCAAPGGKTTLYASLVGCDGLVVANEIDRRRASVLADNVRKWGTGNVAVTCCDAASLGRFEAWFDVVAVDAPCSGEGMFRKDPAARQEWSEANVRLCAARQDEILREAWRALKPGGVLLYSTCTFNRDEDEGSLERMLAWAGDEVTEADPVAVDRSWGICCGEVGPFRTYRFYPHRACGEGFFAAVARKSAETDARMRTPRARRSVVSAVDRKCVAELSRWLREPGEMRFGIVGDTYYAWYAGQAEAVRMLSEALPVIGSGVALGQLFKGVLKPDPALAFFPGLNREALPVAELDEQEALRYLRRQEIAAGALAEGMNLITVRGRGLGFAKRIGGRVNNLYPNSLRIMKQ